MHVAQLLDPLFFVMHIEIVVARLPKRTLPALNRHRQLQRLNRLAEKCLLRFADQKVNVFRHDNIAADNKAVTLSH